MRPLNLIVAVDKKMGISSYGKIPWHIHSDLTHFKQVTKDSVLIMGRKTWESIPVNKRAFKDRKAIVVLSSTITSFDTINGNENQNTPVVVSNNLNEAILKSFSFFDDLELPSIFICGGSRIYQEAIEKFMYMMEAIYITYINDDFMCDNFFPLSSFDPTIYYNMQMLFSKHKKDYPALFTFLITESGINVRRKNLETGSWKIVKDQSISFNTSVPDQCYVDLLLQILKEGEQKPDRTNVGTLSLFNANLSFDLEKGFPLLTRRKIFHRGCFEETLFFLQGKTNTKELENKKVNIWKGNTSREFLDSRGLTMLEEGDMGAGYGWLWRNFGADYFSSNTKVNQAIKTTEETNMNQETNTNQNDVNQATEETTNNKGIDQIENVIKELKTNPHSRRHIVSAWDPQHLWQAALPPCHILFQFYVRKNKFLDCKMTQRSCDVMLGLPFNIASYSLITHIIAKKVGLEPGKLHISIGDAHIYTNHLDAAYEFLSRPCLSWPTLCVNDEVKDKPIEELTISDFTLYNYASFPHISMDMAV